MDLQLAGKTALITGGSKGIGRATAEIMAAEGCNLILVSRSAGDLAAVKLAIAQSTRKLASVEDQLEYCVRHARVPIGTRLR